MDVSFYISELLEQHGEISVPGLGYLVQAYMPGYYNDAEGKFYPPHHRVQFDPQQLDDDDTLTQYIADQKNISLASSKYFTEKFIADIREDALVKDVAIANLGWFNTEQGRLIFKAANQVINDPAFLGYPPVNISRVGEASGLAPIVAANINNQPSLTDINNNKQETADEFYESYKKQVAETIIPQSSVIEEYATADELYDEDEPKRSYGWMIMLIIIIIAALAILGMYKYYPDQFNKARVFVGLKKPDKPIVVKQKEPEAIIPTAIDTAGVGVDTNKQVTTADTSAKKTTKAADSVAKKSKTTIIETRKAKPVDIPARQTKTAVIETKPLKSAGVPVKTKRVDAPVKQTPSPVVTRPVTTPVNQTTTAGFDYTKPWVVLASTNSYGTQAEADAAISNLKKKNIDAFVVPMHSSRINIAVGAYKSNAEADAALTVFKKKGLTDAYLTTITQKK